MNIEVGNTLSLIFFICYQPLTEVCGKISGRQWYEIQMTVNLTVKMLLTEKSSIRDNGLETPLMIEWE